MALWYKAALKVNSRRLRSSMTDSERMLWSKLRGKQLLGIQFYRQKPLGKYIVDFYAPKVKLVLEVDGGQHLKRLNLTKDTERDECLKKLGLRVLRFDNLQVLKHTEAVMEAILTKITKG